MYTKNKQKKIKKKQYWPIPPLLLFWKSIEFLFEKNMWTLLPSLNNM